jgi:hypothetical protein
MAPSTKGTSLGAVSLVAGIAATTAITPANKAWRVMMILPDLFRFAG